MMHSVTPTLSVLIEAPVTRDLHFYGKWFMAAHHAEMAWRKALKDPDFAKCVDSVTAAAIPDFEITASELFGRLGVRSRGCTLRLDEECLNDFVIMTELGFFVSRGDHYRMALPSRIKSGAVKAA